MVIKEASSSFNKHLWLVKSGTKFLSAINSNTVQRNAEQSRDPNYLKCPHHSWISPGDSLIRSAIEAREGVWSKNCADFTSDWFLTIYSFVYYCDNCSSGHASYRTVSPCSGSDSELHPVCYIF